MKTTVEIISRPDISKSSNQPIFSATVSAGFPSPAADYQEGKLDLNRHLIKNAPATFFVRVTGDSMIGAGIHCGDLLIVDRSLEAQNKNVIIAVLNGELTVKRISINKNKITLQPENENYAPQLITPGMEFEVWGVVTNVIHKL
jgi:DNA polymerase V